MDGDVFSRASKLARKVADALHDVLEGRGDPAEAIARCLEKFVASVGGFPLFAEIVEQCRQAWSAPLFAASETRRIAAEAQIAARSAGRTAVDLIAAREAAYVARRGEIRAEELAHRILQSVTDRLIFESKEGYVARYGHARIQDARAALAPTLRRAASRLAQRPNLRRLGLTSRKKVRADTNLLAGGSDE